MQRRDKCMCISVRYVPGVSAHNYMILSVCDCEHMPVHALPNHSFLKMYFVFIASLQPASCVYNFPRAAYAAECHRDSAQSLFVLFVLPPHSQCSSVRHQGVCSASASSIVCTSSRAVRLACLRRRRPSLVGRAGADAAWPRAGQRSRRPGPWRRPVELRPAGGREATRPESTAAARTGPTPVAAARRGSAAIQRRTAGQRVCM